MPMIFPTDVTDRLAYVSFTVSEDEGTSFSATAEMPSVTESTENIQDKEEQKDDRSALEKFFDFNDDGELSFADVRAGYDKAKEQVNKVNDFLGSAGDAIEGVLNDFFGTGQEQQPFKRGRPEFSDPEGNVVLFLPPGFQSTEGLGFDGFDLGLLGSVAENAFQRGDFTLQGLGSDAFETARQGYLESVKEGSATPLARLATTELAKMKRLGIGAGITGAGQAVAGVAVAPNQRTLFKRVNMREFAFTFSLIPSNAEEAATVQRIVKYFRYYLYPKPIMSSDGVRLGYQYPNKFNIKVGTVLGGWEPLKIQPSYLRGLSVTTNPNAAAYHEDGNPVETQISVNFIESATLDRDQEEYVEPPLGPNGGSNIYGGGAAPTQGIGNGQLPDADPFPGAGDIPGGILGPLGNGGEQVA